MPARFSSLSSNLNPNGSIRCSSVFVAAHNRATFPVFGGISGSTSTTRIKHFPQHQAVRGSGHASGTAIARGQHRFNVAFRKLSAPKLHQRAHNASAHLVEKTVTLDEERDHRTALANVAP